MARARVNRYYNPTDGRWTRRDPIGIKGGSNLYSYISNHIYYAYDFLGKSYDFFNRENIKEEDDFQTSNTYYLGETTTGFPRPVPSTHNYKKEVENGAIKYCTKFPDATYIPRITYFLAKERNVGGKKIVYTEVGRDAVVYPNGMTVRDHEMQHVNITSGYWDAFVSESKKMEGCYCSLKCVTLGLLVTKFAYLLNQGYSMRDNALYDIKAYGKNWGGEIFSELTAIYNKALDIIRENRNQYNEYMKQYQDSKCSKM